MPAPLEISFQKDKSVWIHLPNQALAVVMTEAQAKTLRDVLCAKYGKPR
jgi:hypothetical protein